MSKEPHSSIIFVKEPYILERNVLGHTAGGCHYILENTGLHGQLAVAKYRSTAIPGSSERDCTSNVTINMGARHV